MTAVPLPNGYSGLLSNTQFNNAVESVINQIGGAGPTGPIGNTGVTGPTGPAVAKTVTYGTAGVAIVQSDPHVVGQLWWNTVGNGNVFISNG